MLIAVRYFAEKIQATNQLLTAIDRLRLLPNVLILCTSNLSSAIVGCYRSSVGFQT